ncbi:MAG: transglutaminase-like cysteine peptidase [Desulfovibrio sp.]|jgi:predicted transglutaminase-like cysteine proteinase|nr:transglutaminase-like cysteine peptidase [Desulfovibrio sp.]
MTMTLWRRLLVFLWLLLRVTTTPTDALAARSAETDGWKTLLGETRLEASALASPAWRHHAIMWEEVLSEYARDSAEEKDSLRRLPETAQENRRNLEAALPRMKPLEQLSAISGFINFQVKGASDEEVYGVPEKWAAPATCLRLARGDCEDFAIAKYFVLREHGFAAENMRLVIVTENGSVGHMLLAVRIDGHIYIIDNNARPPGLVLKQNEALSRYYKVEFAFNENGVWQYQ